MSCDVHDIALAADLVALIAVSAATAKAIAEGAGNPQKLGSDLHRCLTLASGMAEQAHSALRHA